MGAWTRGDVFVLRRIGDDATEIRKSSGKTLRATGAKEEERKRDRMIPTKIFILLNRR